MYMCINSPHAGGQMPDAPPSANADQLLAGLAPDASPGHEAHTKVRLMHASSNPVAAFTFKAPDGEKIPFQTTAKAAGSLDLCLHIARACYLEFERGRDKSDVIVFRNEQYEISNTNLALVEIQSKASKKSAGTSAQKPLAVASESFAPAAADGQKRDFPNDRSVLEDVPYDSPAWQKVKFRENVNVYRFDYLMPDGEKIGFQTAVLSCGGSQEHAGRIARLCYVKFEQ